VPGQQSQHLLDDRFDSESGSVDANGVIGRPQRRHGTLCVTGIAGENLPQQTA
jgi:hypothetical protein